MKKEVRYVKYFIEYIVDFSAKQSDFIVRSNVDPHLDKREQILDFFIKTFNSRNILNLVFSRMGKTERSASLEKHPTQNPERNGREGYEKARPVFGDELQNGVHTEYRISVGDNRVEPVAGRQRESAEFRVQIHQQQHTLLQES